MLKLVFVIMVATYVCFLAIGEVISVIEMVLDKKDDREVHKVEMVGTKKWRKVKSADAGISMRFSCRDN